MNAKREEEIRRIVRAQVVDALTQDLEGDERVMKEAWEECTSKKDLKIAEDELRRIVALIAALDS